MHCERSGGICGCKIRKPVREQLLPLDVGNGSRGAIIPNWTSIHDMARIRTSRPVKPVAPIVDRAAAASEFPGPYCFGKQPHIGFAGRL